LIIAGGEAQGHLSYPSHRILFCDVCRPVPNDPLVAYDRTPAGGLIVHREDAPCAAAAHGVPVPVRWVERAEVRDKNLTVFQLTAVDRRELLGDLLAKVYSLPTASLMGVEANTQRDGSAEVSMLVETSLAADMVKLQNAINQMPDVQRMIAMPPSTTQSLAGIQVAANPYVPNPYTYSQEVYDRLSFYDRAEPIQRILRWLNDPPPYRRLVLHGRRRVGKSSLVRHLQREVLRAQVTPAVTPVLVDCQSFGNGAAEQTVANHLVEAVCRDMQMTPPQRGPYEEPFAWLNRILQEAVKHLGQGRLLLVLDELSHLIDLQRTRRISPSLFNFLRAITTERRDLNWLLILQDVDYYDLSADMAADVAQGNGGGAASLLYGEEIHLQDFPPSEARKLIMEPMSRCGIECDSHFQQQIIDLTNGNPCLIQALCWYLVERVRSVGRQPTVNSADLDNAVSQVLRMGHLHFEHYLARLSGLRRALVAATAAYTPEGGWMDYTALAAALSARARRSLTPQEAEAAIRALQQQGTLQRDESIDHVCIPVRLFHRWVKGAIDVDTTVEEWMQGSGGTGERRSKGTEERV
jgi:hypothetical protein